MTSREEIETKLRGYLEEMFEVPAEKITPTARLAEDLGLDSIDAVDLVVRLQQDTGKKIPPAEFKLVRTVGDVVDKVYVMLSEGN
jgi:acyl carrier protein